MAISETDRAAIYGLEHLLTRLGAPAALVGLVKFAVGAMLAAKDMADAKRAAEARANGDGAPAQ